MVAVTGSDVGHGWKRGRVPLVAAKGGLKREQFIMEFFKRDWSIPGLHSTYQFSVVIIKIIKDPFSEILVVHRSTK